MVLWQLMQIRIQIPIVDRRINQGKEVSDGQGCGRGCRATGVLIISKTQSCAGNQSNDITNVSLVMGLF